MLSVSVGDVFDEQARSRPQMTALVEAGTRLSYTQLGARVDRAAVALAGLGVGRQDTVLWLGKNSLTILELVGACARLGAVLVPVNWRQSAPELAFVIDDVAPRVIVWQEDGLPSRAARDLATSAAQWIQVDAAGPGSYKQALRDVELGQADWPGVDPALPLLGIYTAAFDGRPGAALLSHTAVLTEALIIGRIGLLSDATVYLNSGPMFHLATLMTSLSVLVHGGTNVVIATADAEAICDAIGRERCNRAFILQPTLEAIKKLSTERDLDLTSLWPSPDTSTWTTWTASFNPETGRSGGYGQTEVSGLLTSAGLGLVSQGVQGRPVPLSQVRIVDEGLVDVGPGQVGEIVCRGPIAMTRFLNRPAVTEYRQRSGWHHTGDLGRREPDGSITFVGPLVRLIKSAAENIYPAEIEACLRSHEAVSDVCVIGVPDPVWTQSVKALVVRSPGREVSAVELIDYCRLRIASYKKPRIIEFLNELPRRPDGGVDRDRADAEYGGGGYPGA